MYRILITTASTMLALGLCGAAFAAPVTGQLSLEGYAESANSVGMGSATGLNFASGSSVSPTISGSSGGLYTYGGGSGAFAAIGSANSSTGALGTINDIANFSTALPTAKELTIDTGGPAISFDLTSIASASNFQDMTGGSVTFTALGIVNFSGFDPTPATLALTAQGNNIVSFSATLTALSGSVPEPASLGLLGLGGLILSFGVRRRRHV